MICARPRRGVALAAVLGLMALLGILIAGAVAASGAAQRTARLSQTDAVLSASADYSLSVTLASWQESLLADLPLGVPRTIETTAPQTTPVPVTVTTTRLPDDVLWLVADARASGVDPGRRRFGLVARFAVPGRVPPAGIVARGNVVLAAGVRAIVDTSGEADCAAHSDAPAVLTAPGAIVTSADSVRSDVSARAADSATYYQAAWQRTLLDSAIAVRHVLGDTTIAGGSYQGILQVDGTLRITAPFSATGLVIARGSIGASDSVNITGALLSFATSPATAISLSSGTIQYAPCVVARVLRHASPPRPVRERSWSEIF